MAVGKEIRNQIGSVKNTQKITKAMQLVAASKMRKAQERMEASKPYAEKIRAIVGHLSQAHSEYHHPYLQEIADEDVKRVGYVIISTDRGLCGGLNINLFKTAVNSMKEWQEKGVEADLALIGRKAGTFFGRFPNIQAKVGDLGDSPKMEELLGSIKVMLDAYDEGKIQRLYIVQNEFINTMTQQAEVMQLLPVEPKHEKEIEYHWDYIYEPEAPVVLDTLLKRYTESLVYQAVVENVACEMAARMVAMKSATDNAGELIKELQLVYNKARQAAITQELGEIVAGAAAV